MCIGTVKVLYWDAYPNVLRDRRTALLLRNVWQGQWPFECQTGQKIEKGEFYGPCIANFGIKAAFQRFDLIAKCNQKLGDGWVRLEKAHEVRPAGACLICVSCGGNLADKGAKINADAFAARCEDAALRAASRLTEGEIRGLVGKVEHTELHWLGDDPDNPMLTLLMDSGGVVHCRGALEDFQLIHSFQKVAIGQSAFQWWRTVGIRRGNSSTDLHEAAQT